MYTAIPALRSIAPPPPAPAAAAERVRRPGAGDIGRVGLPVYLSMVWLISVYMGALTPVLRSVSGSGALKPGESDLGSSVTQFAALGVVTYWLWTRRTRMHEIVRPLFPYLLIAALCFASIGWSAYPFNSLRRSVTVTVCILYGAYLCDQLGLEATVRLVKRTVVVLAVLSIVVYVAVPSVGRDTGQGYENAMRGVFAAKNTAGEAMLLTVPCVIWLGSLPGANKWVAAVEAAFVFFALVLTRSATSSVITLVVLALALQLWMRGGIGRVVWKTGLACTLVLIAATVLFWPEQIFPLLGRDASFTGRVPLWQECLVMIGKRPLLGYGYSGFWNVDSHDVQYMWRKIGWEAPNGHDGYIDILLQLGVVGLFLYMVVWGSVIWGAIRHVRAGTMPEASWMLLFMTGNVFLNLNEGPLPFPDEFTLLVSASLLALWRAKRGLVSRDTRDPAPVRTQERFRASSHAVALARWRTLAAADGSRRWTAS